MPVSQAQFDADLAAFKTALETLLAAVTAFIALPKVADLTAEDAEVGAAAAEVAAAQAALPPPPAPAPAPDATTAGVVGGTGSFLSGAAGVGSVDAAVAVTGGIDRVSPVAFLVRGSPD